MNISENLSLAQIQDDYFQAMSAAVASAFLDEICSEEGHYNGM